MLPGGVWRDDQRHRSFRLRPLTGDVELSIGDAWDSRRSVPGGVTAALTAAIAEVGGVAADIEAVGGLSVGDRHYLVRQLAGHMGRSVVWLTAQCPGCGEAFDFSVDQAELPAKPAPPTPVDCATSIGVVTVRPPTGADQEAIADGDDNEAMRRLLARCVRRDGAALDAADIEALLEADLPAIDKALATCSPEVTSLVAGMCPECGVTAEIRIDPYLFLDSPEADLLADVHTVASAYHWSEAEILSLPRSRRMQYLARIEGAGGLGR